MAAGSRGTIQSGAGSAFASCADKPESVPPSDAGALCDEPHAEGNEGYRNWAMIRGAIWVAYGFVHLRQGAGSWIDIALNGLFLASMVGFLFGAPSRARIAGSSVVFGVYALAMVALIALALLAPR